MSTEAQRYFCQKCGKSIDLNLNNYEFREMMLSQPDKLKKLLGEWYFREEQGNINLYCPDC